uniref:ubiquitinyl hydrolase 1 n=1 Tax=Glossina brevipalpis TaxID=37001 RepID=A0A1A9W534_9MUSC
MTLRKTKSRRREKKTPEGIDGGNAPNEFNNYMHAAESISSLCESANNVQLSSENLANDYQQHYNIAQQQQQQLIQQHHHHHQQSLAETPTNDIYSNELQDNAINNGLRSDAIEVTIATSLVKNQPQSLGYMQQQPPQTESRFKSTSTAQQTQSVATVQCQTITQTPYQQHPQHPQQSQQPPLPQQQQQQSQQQQQQHQQQQHQPVAHYHNALTPPAAPSQQQHQTSHYHTTGTAIASTSSSSSSSSYHTSQYAYETRKQSQSYNPQQTRRKYDYQQHHGSSNNSNETVTTQPTKTMSWTNSSQHKKSTNTVAVTATPSNSNIESRYNKQSATGSGATSANSSYGHGSRTYTNQQHHNYHQQQQQYTPQPQTRTYGAMKMPSSPISSTSTQHSNPVDRKNSQVSETGKQTQFATTTTIATVPSTSTASTTITPLQFQQPTTQQVNPSSIGNGNANDSAVSNKQYPPGFANKKLIMQQQTMNNTIISTTTTTNTTGTDINLQPTINLAPPVSTAAPSTNPSTPSWASLFNNKSSSLPFNNTSISNLPSGTTTPQNFGNTASPALPPPFSKKPIAKVAPYEGITPVVPALPSITPGAMSYSAASAQGLPQMSSNKKPLDNQSQRHSLANIDEFTIKFAEFLTKYKSDLTAISLRPRGLTNRSNYCYINSILQALLGCAPFYNLIRSIPKQAAVLCEVKTPTVNAMITFMSNFSNLPTGLRLRTTKGPKNKDDLSGELQCDSAFEPTEIYKLWNDSREEHVEGRQEDAEEFLSYILNKLNDEMLEILKLIAKPNSEQNGQNEQSENEEGDAWQMIRNNRNKGSVTRQTDFGHTPLSDIFRGELRSRLQREGEHSTDVIQPFFTLQLNIEASFQDKAASVKEALEILVGRDQLEGVTGSKTKQEVVAWQQMTLEKLPIVLILHLKWFDYRSDGCTKILKKVEFPVELKIDAKILASKKYSQKQRAYRLFAVVYHDGKEASKGHYITDVYHTGYGSWLRYDDSSVKPVSENHVLVPRTPRVPYLLYYRRCDTLPPQINSSSSSNSSSNNNSNTSGNTAMTLSSGK